MAKSTITTAALQFGTKSFSKTGSVTSTNDNYIEQTGTATVTPAALDTGDVVIKGVLVFQNLDTTIPISLSLDGGTTYPIVIKPLHVNLISLGALGAITVKTLSSTATYEYFLTEE